MQTTPKDILTEERLNDLGTAFADCIKELCADKLPDLKFIVYIKTPKFDDQGKASSELMCTISDDSVDEETLGTYINSLDQPLNKCFLDKLSANKDRDPERNSVVYHGLVLTLGEGEVSMVNNPIGDLPLDESQWIKMVEFAQEKNWYSKFEIIGGLVGKTVIQISVHEIWVLLKSHLSESNESGDDTLSKLMEKIKDLPLEEILEEIRRNFPKLFL